MKIREHARLIPRNNWDYGLDALFGTLTGVGNHATRSANVEAIFRRRPIWTNSGRTSLYVILKSLDLPAPARIGVPLFCCSVVFDAISQAGFSPCFLDSNLDDCNISVADLQNKRSNLAALVAVHMFGNPCDIDAILALAESMPVIEDCAQSVYSTYKGKPTGTLATASFFSFRCGKYISAGEGSAILCTEPQLQVRIQRFVDALPSWSMPKMLIHSLMTFAKATLYSRPWYGLIGYPIGMRLDKKLNLTAKGGFEAGKMASTHLSLVDARIARFQTQIDIQRRHAQILLDSLVPGKFCLPTENNGCSSNWYQFALRFQSTDQRDAMADYLYRQGIDTAKYLDTIADEARLKYGYQGDCPNAELLAKTILLVPIHYVLRTRDIEHIARSINEASRLI